MTVSKRRVWGVVAAVGCALMVVAVFGMRFVTANQPDAVRLGAAVSVGGVTYCAGVGLLYRERVLMLVDSVTTGASRPTPPAAVPSAA